VSHVRVIDADRSLFCRNETNNHVKAGGFSRTIGTQESNDFSWFYPDVDPSHDLSLTVGFAQVFG
jgi:hypothetical protein